MIDQTIWLSPKCDAYTVVCEECAAEHGFLAAQVEGRWSSSASTVPSPARGATRSASSAPTTRPSACSRSRRVWRIG